MKRIIKSSRTGFTLLEVILAVAILLICSMMLIKGFLSTLQYTNNTSVYVKLSGTNYGSAIDHIAAKSNALTSSAATHKMTVKSTISADGLTSVIGVNSTKYSTLSSNVNSLTARYTEGQSSAPNRTSFWLGNECPDCHNGFVYAYDQDNDDKVDGYFCGSCGHTFTTAEAFINR